MAKKGHTRNAVKSTSVDLQRKVSDMEIAHHSIPETMQALHLTRHQVRGYREKAEAEFKEAIILNRAKFVLAEVRVLMRIQFEAWKGWELSLKQTIQTERGITEQLIPNMPSFLLIKKGGIKTVTLKQFKKTIKQGRGNPKFLNLIRTTSESRRRLLGLDAEEKITIDTRDGFERRIENMSDAELRKMINDQVKKDDSIAKAKRVAKKKKRKKK